MPSAAATVLSAGFTALLGTNGEPVTLTRANGSTVGGLTAIIDRAPGERRQMGPNMLPRDASVIELRLNAVTPAPKAGESFTDENGLLHRIQSTRRLAEFISCTCRVSDAA